MLAAQAIKSKINKKNTFYRHVIASVKGMIILCSPLSQPLDKTKPPPIAQWGL
jgi:hypothetical protein